MQTANIELDGTAGARARTLAGIRRHRGIRNGHLTRMRSFFSEFSYGFALTRELVAHDPGILLAAPEFPSLVAEGQPGGGYDVQVPFPAQPLFLQFKVSERMVRQTAKEWDEFGQPYFRFKLHARRYSEQRQMLIDLELAGNEVYYAAPMFHRPEVLNQCFRDATVVDHTAFFSPHDIGPLPDNDEHTVSFLPASQFGVVRSEPRRIPVSAFGRSVRESIDRPKDRPRRLLETADDVGQLAELLDAIVAQRRAFLAPAEEPVLLELPPLPRAVYVARTFFDAELLLVAQG